MLALYPKEFAKLRRAVIDDLGSETDPTGMDFQKLKSCKYMSYVLNETLRLFPSVPINARVAVRDTVIPKGGGPDRQSPIALRKDDVVTFCVYAMHRRKDLWGEDAWEFKVRMISPVTTRSSIDTSYSPNAGSVERMTGLSYPSMEDHEYA